MELRWCFVCVSPRVLRDEQNPGEPRVSRSNETYGVHVQVRYVTLTPEKALENLKVHCHPMLSLRTNVHYYVLLPYMYLPQSCYECGMWMLPPTYRTCIKQGVGRPLRVGLCLRNNLERILKAGGAVGAYRCSTQLKDSSDLSTCSDSSDTFRQISVCPSRLSCKGRRKIHFVHL